MNVLHIHTRDQGGGGAKMVSNINERLNREFEVDSKLIVGYKSTESDSVWELDQTLPERAFNRLFENVISFNGLGSFRSFWTQKIIRDNNIDIVHLHNLHGRYFNFLNVELIPETTSVVWTFHDIWPMTGGCTHSNDCTKFEASCGSCPELENYPSMEIDTTPILHKLKTNIFNRTNITGVAPSQWMVENIDKSRLSVNDIRHVPNGIDTEMFYPRDRRRSRNHWDIGEDRTVVLFAANNIDNPQKGMQFLISALKHLSHSGTGLELLVIGGNAPTLNELPPEYEYISPGYIPQEMLPLAYSAADLSVVPSKMESFGLVATESMACGTPVVAFNVGGLGEQITSDTGWLVSPYDTDQLASTIESALSDEGLLKEKGQNARERVINKYDIQQCVDEYRSIYDDVYGS